jgi:hypothetical protein
MKYHQKQQLQQQTCKRKSVSNLLLNFPTPGVAKATGTVTTKPNEIKTNKAVKAVIINILKNFLLMIKFKYARLKITFL